MCTMGCAEGIVKLLVFGANVVFALGGLALIIVGVLYKLNISDFTDAIPADYDDISLAPILTIVVGCIIFVIAFFGCCGAIRESSCLLTTYAVILLIIFLLQIAVGVFVFLEIKDKDQFHRKVETQVKKIFSNEDHNKELIKLIQKNLKCCGATGPKFWPGLPPPTCYGKQGDPSSLYYTGCESAFYDFLMNSMRVIGIVLLSLSALEVVGCVFSLCLSSSIKNRERRFRY